MIEEMVTIRPIDKSYTIQVFINELGTYVYMKLAEDSPAVLSLGRLFNDMGYSYGLMSTELPLL